MDTVDEMDEDQLTEYAIQLSIQESIQASKNPPPAYRDSLASVSEENRRIVSAIELGEIFLLQQLSKCTLAFGEADERGWLPLHKAAVQPIDQVLEIVLDASSLINLEQATLDGETALTLAAQGGHDGNVKALLEKGASPYTTNSKQESPLLLAVRHGSYDMVLNLIKNEAPVDQFCIKRWTAMHEAAKLGLSNIVRLLIRSGGNVNEKDAYGVTPLATAAEYGRTDALELLILKGGNIHATADDGATVLFDAAGGGNPDCVEVLLEYGASANMPNISGHLPIHRAAYLGHYLVLKTLIPITSKSAIKKSGLSPMHSAADGGSVQCLQLLIENGFDVNVLLAQYVAEIYEDGRKSPLYFAVSNADVTCTELLLKYGADPNNDPLNCFLVAVRARSYEIVKLLLAHGADVNCWFMVVNDTHFPTAIQYCLKDEMMMRLLLNNGYDAKLCFDCMHGDSSGTSFAWRHLETGWTTCVNKDTPHNNISCQQNLLHSEKFCDFITLSWLTDVAGKVVRILLDYMDFVPICSKLKPCLEKQKEWPEICEILENPRPLKHLCRLVIRRQMKLYRLQNQHFMDLLPLPPILKHYILYREYDLYGKGINMK
ncbi:ankyrin repeat and SOCS box protein 15 isoform X1 [Acipenser ruthenus]|uniref:ankyrin repeat and SOCS box protein 15 isoform X1 n=1 Tax=Acipenser ruthenus TaxID=7906 RepID=UPI00155FB885|nr:ankyrin repeat and SOCS box protein 15 isoform X1 [Acipenser ruthenus]